MKRFIEITKQLLKFYLKYKWGFFAYLLLVTISSIATNIEPFFYKVFIDKVTITKLTPEIFPTFIFLLIGIALMRFFSGAILEFAFVVFDRGFFLKSAVDLQNTIFKHVQSLSFDFHQNKKAGSLISIMTRGNNAFYSYTFNVLFNAIFFGVSLLFLVLTMSFINTKLMLVIILTIICISISSIFLIRENLEKRKALNAIEDKTKALIADSFVSYETVKYHRQERFEESRLRSINIDFIAKALLYTNTYRKFGIIISSITATSIFASLYIALQDLVSHSITIGTFVLILTFLTQMYRRLSDMFSQFRELAKNFADLESYVDILNYRNDLTDIKEPKKIITPKGKVEFKNVTFNYKGRSSILKDINFIIKPNHTVALVGKSGAGKTTISKLLLRLYDIQEGEILIDGINIKELKQNDLKSIVGMVPQDPLLFNNTIGYNIAYAYPESSIGEIKKAAKIAFLDEFIESLPQKYDTEVGERGIKLSGGQRQRLAIARAMIQNPKILIFDEATSHLDSESEYYIQKALEQVSKDKTVIIIAHRLSTILHSDNILVFEHGNLVDQGTHEELLNNNSHLYKKLWSLQSKGELYN